MLMVLINIVIVIVVGAILFYLVTGQVRLHFFPQTTVQNFLDSGI